MEIRSGVCGKGDIAVFAVEESKWAGYLDSFCQYTRFAKLGVDVVDLHE